MRVSVFDLLVPPACSCCGWEAVWLSQWVPNWESRPVWGHWLRWLQSRQRYAEWYWGQHRTFSSRISRKVVIYCNYWLLYKNTLHHVLKKKMLIAKAVPSRSDIRPLIWGPLFLKPNRAPNDLNPLERSHSLLPMSNAYVKKDHENPTNPLPSYSLA